MLQVTGHAGGVGKATLERERSVDFPSEGNNFIQQFFSVHAEVLYSR